jgi:hypothetical protein
MVFRTPSRDDFCERVVGDVLGAAAMVVVQGGRGVGKTSLIPILADAMEARGLVVIRMQAAGQSPLAAQRQIGAAFGLPTDTTIDPDGLFNALHAERGLQRIVLLFDDADKLSKTMFLYVGRLVELAQTGLTHIRVVLLGGVADWAGLEDEDLDSTRPDKFARHVLFPFSDGEALAYLDHQFRLAGRSLNALTTAAAAAELIAISGGMASQLTALTEDALSRCFLARRKRITVGILRDAAARGPAAVSVTAPAPRRVSFGMVAALLTGCVAAGAVGLVILRTPLPDHGPPPISDASANPAPLPEIGEAAPAPAPILLPEPTAPFNRVLEQAAHSAITPPTEQTAQPSAAALPAVQLPATVAAAPSSPNAPAAASLMPSSQTAAIEPTQIAPGLNADARFVDQVWPRQAEPPAKPDRRVAVQSVDRVRLPAPLARPDLRVAAESIDQVWPVLPAPPVRRDLRIAMDPVDQVWPRQPASPPTVSMALPAPAPTAPAASFPAPTPGGPGLVLLAGEGDTIDTLYAKIYRGLTPPPYAAVIAANHVPLKPGMLVVFPAPPGGWSQ